MKKGRTMSFLDKGFDPIIEVQKTAGSAGKGIASAAGEAANAAQCAANHAGQIVAAVANKAEEIADGVKQGVENARVKEPDEYELAIIDYNQTYTDLESGGIELYQSRLRSIDLLDLVTDLVNSVANTPKSFAEDIEEASHKKQSFKESEAFAREELDSARKSAASAGAGVAAGMAVAQHRPICRHVGCHHFRHRLHRCRDLYAVRRCRDKCGNSLARRRRIGCRRRRNGRRQRFPGNGRPHRMGRRGRHGADFHRAFRKKAARDLQRKARGAPVSEAEHRGS